NIEEFYQTLLCNDVTGNIVLGNSQDSILKFHLNDSIAFKNKIEYMQYVDTKMYLPGDILTKVDRASMAVSLEARVPLLDHRVLEFAWQLPFNFKVFDGQRKWILKQILYKYVPQHIFDRPKQGFGVPIGDWLRGRMKEWVSSQISEHTLNSFGFLDSQLILSRWDAHLAYKEDWSEFLWAVLMFVIWYSKYKTFFKGCNI